MAESANSRGSPVINVPVIGGAGRNDESQHETSGNSSNVTFRTTEPQQPTTVGTQEEPLVNTMIPVRRNSIFPDPRGSVIEDEEEMHVSTSSAAASPPPNQNETFELRTQPQEAPPPYPGLPRSLTAHLRQRDDISRYQHSSAQSVFNQNQIGLTNERARVNVPRHIPSVVSSFVVAYFIQLII